MTREPGLSPTARPHKGRPAAVFAAAVFLAVVFLAVVLLAVVLSAGLLVAGGCGGPAATGGRPLVVTSVPLIYSLTVNVAGDAVRVEELLPPGASPHQTSFTPAQARLVAEADMLIINGAGLEFWVDDLVKSSGNPDLRVVVASKGVTLLRPGEPTPIPGSAGGGESTGGADPHIWLDPANALVMVDNIRAALKALDPSGAAGYDRRATEYKARIRQLDGEIRAALAGVPRRDFVSFHSAFQYYARAYGLNQVAVIEEFPGKEPSPQYLTGVVDLVKKLGVKAVFSEPQFSPRPAEALAREAGVQVYEVDPEGSTLSATMYEDLLRHNTEVFRKALGGS